MSFKTAYEALFNQLKDYSVLRKYMNEEDFYDEFRQAFPQKNYIVFLEPGPEEVEVSRGTKGITLAFYNIEVIARLN
jgi:hypothetical protein